MRKILLIGEFQPGSLGLYYERAFQSLNSAVTRYDYGRAYAVPGPLQKVKGLRRVLRPLLWRRMSREVASLAGQRWDLIVAFKAAFLDRPAVDRLRAACGATVMIYPDSPWDEYTQRADLIPVLRRFARTYIWSHPLAARLAEEGVSARYLPFGYDPEYAGGQAGAGVRSGIAFAAQPYANRVEWLKALEGLPVTVYGKQWSQSWFGGGSTIRVVGRTPMGPEAARIYGSAAAGLNIAHPKNFSGHNMRTFELPATGALMIANRTDDLPHYFPEGRACLAAANAEEFRAHCEFAIANPGEASRIAATGREYAAAHTYASRAQMILDDLEAEPR